MKLPKIVTLFPKRAVYPLLAILFDLRVAYYLNSNHEKHFPKLRLVFGVVNKPKQSPGLCFIQVRLYNSGSFRYW